jgi:hypothetical protein
MLLQFEHSPGSNCAWSVGPALRIWVDPERPACARLPRNLKSSQLPAPATHNT